jgi:hypothetical protein
MPAAESREARQGILVHCGGTQPRAAISLRQLYVLIGLSGIAPGQGHEILLECVVIRCRARPGGQVGKLLIGRLSRTRTALKIGTTCRELGRHPGGELLMMRLIPRAVLAVRVSVLRRV